MRESRSKAFPGAPRLCKHPSEIHVGCRVVYRKVRFGAFRRCYLSCVLAPRRPRDPGAATEKTISVVGGRHGPDAAHVRLYASRTKPAIVQHRIRLVALTIVR